MARILVVDDDDAIRYAFVRLLAGAGHEVVEAHDYHDALPIIEDGSRIDLLVTDVVLPEVHGFALARMARMKHRNIPVVYVTGHELGTSEALGPVLHKPVADDALLAAVVAALTPAATA